MQRVRQQEIAFKNNLMNITRAAQIFLAIAISRYCSYSARDVNTGRNVHTHRTTTGLDVFRLIQRYFTKQKTTLMPFALFHLL